VIFGVTIGGLLLGRRRRHRSETLGEPFSILQTSLLGVVGLLLAFGLALAVGRYEARRALTNLRREMQLPPSATGPANR
jgi:hypothetical protein